MGIGGYNLKIPADRAVAFDYSSSGRLDYLVLYRPGEGAIFIVAHQPDGSFSPVYSQGNTDIGIGAYDLASAADKVFAFDYTHSGKLDHLVLYRPGTGKVSILQNIGGLFTPVYETQDGGIGGYDLMSPDDLMFAYDAEGSGRNDYLAVYRPGAGFFWVLQNKEGAFAPVFVGTQGVGGYDLLSTLDRVLPFDYEGNGRQNYILLYRPGVGDIWIERPSLRR